jgi:hypothetical protein
MVGPLSALAEALHRFDPPWIEVGRIYRRICFLRCEGLTTEAQVVEQTEFAEAARRARQASESEDEADSLLKTLLAEEGARVAEAIAFAEVLVPVLAKRLAALIPSPRALLAAPAPRERKPGRDENRSVADFIDDMLAQERTGTA